MTFFTGASTTKKSSIRSSFPYISLPSHTAPFHIAIPDRGGYFRIRFILKSDTIMEENSERYVLVLEDRSDTKSPADPGRLSVISGQDEKGKIKTVEPTEENRAAFLVFKKNDGLLKNFMTNLRRQFNDPTHFGVYRIVADRVGESVESLKDMLAARDMPQNKAALDSIRINPDESPTQKLSAIDPEKVDWKELECLGVSREKLEANGNLDRLLNWQKTGLISLAVPFGDTTIYTEARLALRTGADGRLSLNIHTLRREPQLDFPYMGHTFSPEEKEQLLSQGNLGKTVELSPKKGEPFRAYVSVDRLTNELVSLRADRVQIPHEIKGVRLSEEQHRALTEGRPVQVEGMLSRHGKPFDATLQVNAEKRGIEFISKDSLSNKERLKSSAKEAPAVRKTENKPQKRGIGR